MRGLVRRDERASAYTDHIRPSKARKPERYTGNLVIHMTAPLSIYALSHLALKAGIHPLL